MLLGALALGDVDDGRQRGRRMVHHDAARIFHHVELAAVGRYMAEARFAGRVPPGVGRVGAQAGQAEGEEGLALIAVEAQCRLVDVQEMLRRFRRAHTSAPDFRRTATGTGFRAP